MKIKGGKLPNSITMKTGTGRAEPSKQATKWWLAKTDKQCADEVLGTAAFLKEGQSYRYRQASTFARLYGNIGLFSQAGVSASKMDTQKGLPQDRPTFNLIQAAIDTLVARIGQARPAPTFLTDNSNYKNRKLSKQLNSFILGEFHNTRAYEKAIKALKDSCVMGDGVLHVFEDEGDKVGVERVLETELLVDLNESAHGDPRQLFRLKLVDRDVLAEMFPDNKTLVAKATTAYPDNTGSSSKTASDMVMVVEAWHLKSGPDAKDGRHVIACAGGGMLFDEKYDKDKFPFVFLPFSTRLHGFWAQGIAEQLMGTQLEINSLLHTISKAIKLVGVPRVFIENGSKVVKSHLDNEIGTIITYTGMKPSYEVAACVPQELYAQLQRCIDYGFQQVGVSAMAATSQKPAGLNSGEAIRSYDDMNTDRMATISKAYDQVFVDLAYLVAETAKDICERTGSYRTIYPSKDGTKEIDLPSLDIIKDPFVIQCFNMSSLPREPSGRLEKVTEMIQSGMVTLKEGRRLLDYPDISQIEKLANASEERIYCVLDKIVEDGEYTPPDPFMDLQLAQEIVVQYYNLYVPAKLEEERVQMLRDFHSQIGDLLQAAQPPAPMAPPGMDPAAGGAPAQATAAPLPVSPLIPR